MTSLVIGVALLGLGALVASGFRYSHGADLLTQAVNQARDMADRMRANLEEWMLATMPPSTVRRPVRPIATLQPRSAHLPNWPMLTSMPGMLPTMRCQAVTAL